MLVSRFAPSLRVMRVRFLGLHSWLLHAMEGAVPVSAMGMWARYLCVFLVSNVLGASSGLVGHEFAGKMALVVVCRYRIHLDLAWPGLLVVESPGSNVFEASLCLYVWAEWCGPRGVGLVVWGWPREGGTAEWAIWISPGLLVSAQRLPGLEVSCPSWGLCRGGV